MVCTQIIIKKEKASMGRMPLEKIVFSTNQLHTHFLHIIGNH